LRAIIPFGDQTFTTPSIKCSLLGNITMKKYILLVLSSFLAAVSVVEQQQSFQKLLQQNKRQKDIVSKKLHINSYNAAVMAETLIPINKLK